MPEASSAVTVKLNGTAEVALDGAVTEKCVVVSTTPLAESEIVCWLPVLGELS